MTELTRKRDSLLELIREHEAIHCQIEQLGSAEELEAEPVEYLKICDNHDRFVERMTSLIQAISAWTLGQRIQDEMFDLLDATTLNPLPLKEAFKVVVQDYGKLRDSIRIHSTRSELVKLKIFLEPLMKRFNEKAAIDFKPADSPDFSVNSLHHSSGSCTNFMSPMPTPSRHKLGLPKFSGELLDWREFWSIFSARIEREAGLTDIEKITCLEDAINDQTAKDLVHLNGYGGSYDNVVQALQARYD